MKAVLQRVISAKVEIDSNVVGEINEGLLVLLGVVDGDTEKEATFLAQKIVNLRIFEDENGKMNRSVLDQKGGVLVVSNFTLCANARKGNRPSFTASASPAVAETLYDYVADLFGDHGVGMVEKGVFGADMKVSLVNDGPVTIILDTDEIMAPKSSVHSSPKNV